MMATGPGRTNRSLLFERNVFINCPFDDEYTKLLRPLLFTVIWLGFVPRISTETSDSAQNRLQKICSLIRESRLSIHDLSRLKPTGNSLARMNMPFELGVDYGSREYGHAALPSKRCLILGAREYDYQKALSDLSGVDIKAHQEDPEALVRVVRDWFFETGDVRPAPNWREIWFSFSDFNGVLYDAAKRDGLSEEDLERMPTAEFVHYAQQYRARFTGRAVVRSSKNKSAATLRKSVRSRRPLRA